MKQQTTNAQMWKRKITLLFFSKKRGKKEGEITAETEKNSVVPASQFEACTKNELLESPVLKNLPC